MRSSGIVVRRVFQQHPAKVVWNGCPSSSRTGGYPRSTAPGNPNLPLNGPPHRSISVIPHILQHYRGVQLTGLLLGGCPYWTLQRSYSLPTSMCLLYRSFEDMLSRSLERGGRKPGTEYEACNLLVLGRYGLPGMEVVPANEDKNSGFLRKRAEE